jgi:hypothetical protein
VEALGLILGKSGVRVWAVKMSKPQLLRSNKYQGMSDQKILKLHMKNLGGEDQHFLGVEVDIRQLKKEADFRSLAKTRPKHSFWYYLLYAFLFALFAGRFFSGLV